MSTIRDSRENDPMTRAEEGGEQRRNAFLRHNLNGGSRSFYFYLRVLHTCTPSGPLCSSSSNIGGHRKLFCRKAILPFGSHQPPLYRVSRSAVYMKKSTGTTHVSSDFSAFYTGTPTERFKCVFGQTGNTWQTFLLRVFTIKK